MSDRSEAVTVATVAVAVVLLAALAAGSCIGCTRAQAEACKSVMVGGTEQSKLLAVAPGGICYAVGR